MISSVPGNAELTPDPHRRPTGAARRRSAAWRPAAGRRYSAKGSTSRRSSRAAGHLRPPAPGPMSAGRHTAGSGRARCRGPASARRPPCPTSSRVSQLPQPPDRQPDSTATPWRSAKSSRFWSCPSQASVRPRAGSGSPPRRRAPSMAGAADGTAHRRRPESLEVQIGLRHAPGGQRRHQALHHGPVARTGRTAWRPCGRQRCSSARSTWPVCW